MKKNTFTNKHIIIIVLIVMGFIILRTILPLLIVTGLFLFIKFKNKPKIEQKPPRRNNEVIDTSIIEADKALLEECEQTIANDRQIRQETDLRQFQGRSNVTKEELATYMFEQRRWDGVYERHIQMEEIIKVCNLTLDDVAWVEDELKHYHPDPNQPNFILDNKCCYVRNEEEKAVNDYLNEQGKARIQMAVAKEEQDFKTHSDFMKEIGLGDEVLQGYENGHNELMNEYQKSMRRYDYDAWLEKEGYTHG